jgi:aspartate/methionine/tyrosine aminotransferase
MRHSLRGQVDPFIVMDVMEAAARAEAAGRHVIHMEVGQPGTPAPLGARQALAQALEQPLGYTVALGLPALRQGIADLYRRWYGVDLDPARVVVTPGSSGAFILAFSALFDAGDRVAMGYPGYPSYRQILRAMSLTPVGIPTRPEDRYQPRPQDLPDDVQGLILASPGNPSGTVLTVPELAGLTQAAAARGMAVISDEIYHGLSYADRCHSALEVTDEVLVVNSFSKYFSMTGWRVGWMVVPPDMVRTVERLAQNLFMEGLPRAGFDRIAPPEGAFYIYADVSHLTDDSVAFAAEILDKAGVAVTPGLDFDPDRGARTLRFSYARATADIAEGLARLTAFMAAR